MNNILLEGGNAIVPLLSVLQNHQDNKVRKLYIGKITDEDLDALFPEKYGVFPRQRDSSYIGRLLSFLNSKKLIDSSYSPRFLLGSTRLAALKNYGKDAIWTDKLETDDIIQMASGKKTEFGDFDLDVVLKADKKNVVDAINNLDSSTYIARQSSSDINIAIRIGDKVIQVDLIDVSKQPESANFLKKSSFVDLSSDIKGVFSIYLLRAVAAHMEIKPADALDAVLKFANTNHSSPFAISLNKKLKNNFKPVKVRFSLGAEGLKLSVDLVKKDNKEINEKVVFDIEPRSDYKNLDILAQQILQDPTATGSDIFHAVSLAKFVRDRKPHKVKQIWEEFSKLAESKIKPGLDPKEYQIGIQELEKIIGNPNGTIMKEGREAVGRFEGKNQFSNPVLYDLLYNIVKETGNEGKPQFELDLRNNKAVDMIEKMDSTFCNFGLDRNGKFFMESSNSGPVYENNVNEKFGFNTDLLSSFQYLNENKKFQSSLKKLFRSVGPFKYDSELFPILTHQGNESGEVIFVATKYRKEKFGKFGAFVVFKALLWNDSSLGWYRPEPDKNIQVINLLKHEADSSGWSKDWKIYTNETDMKMSGIVNIDLGRYLASYYATPHMFQRGLSVLQSRTKSSEKDQLIIELEKLRKELQGALDGFANKTKSVLGGNNSYIEGVIMRVKTSTGDVYEVKGTSQVFDAQKELLWGDRAAILNLESEFESNFLKNVLGLKTSQPAALNKLISQAADEFVAKTNGGNKKVEFIHFLLPRLVSGDVDFDMTKSNALSIMEDIEKSYDLLLKNFEMNESSMDADSVRKTKDFFSAFKKKFTDYKTLVRSNLNGSEYYIKVLDSIIGFRIDKFLNTSSEEDTKEETKREKVIIWSGRAQPWHKGHDAMIQKGKAFLEKLGATKILIMIVKGSESSKNKDENPLNEKEQATLLYSIYKNDPQVEIYNKFPKSGFLFEILDHLTTTGYVVSGWLAGPDRINEYRKTLSSYKPSMFKETHEYSPIIMDPYGHPLMEMIETPRTMSGTEARNMAKQTEFKEWVQNIAPDHIDSSAVRVYKTIYNTIRGETLNETLHPEFITEKELLSYLEEEVEEEINEMSAMGVGAVEIGANNMDREDFLEELKLRKFIKETIRNLKENLSKERFETLKEEKKLRSMIKTLILKESEEDRPHHSTGINVLSDLLKKVVPVIEIDYKKMTSSPNQRQSFRAHILKATTNALDVAQSSNNADTEGEGSVEDTDLAEAEISLDVDGQPEKDPEADKFIDIERPSQKKSKEKKVDPVKAFSIEGEDTTGRNIAMSCFDKVETAIVDSYSILSDPEDQKTFYNYLITNLKLYFERFETELKATADEPQVQSDQDQDMTPPDGL